MALNENTIILQDQNVFGLKNHNKIFLQRNNSNTIQLMFIFYNI
jgi:hypothetical protein